MHKDDDNETEKREYRMSLLAHQKYYQGRALLMPKYGAIHQVNSTVLQSMLASLVKFARRAT